MPISNPADAARIGHASVRGWLWIVLATLLLTANAVAGSEPEDVPGADIGTIRNWLLAHNPDLAVLRAQADAARAGVVSAAALPDPSIAITRQDGVAGYPAGMPTVGDGTSYEIRQRIPLWGKRALARSIAQAQAQTADDARRALALDLLAQAETAYVRYWHAQASLRLIQARLLVLDQLVQVARDRQARALGTQRDLLRAQLARASALGERIDRQQDGTEAGIALNRLLGRRIDARLQAPAATPPLAVASGDLATALAQLERGEHPALQGARAQLTAAADTLRLRQRERWPDVTLGVGAMQRGSRLDGRELMLEVELPLQRRALAARERQAQSLADAAQAGLDARQAQLGADLGLAWTQWQAARQRRTLLEDTRSVHSRAAFDTALADYRLGLADFDAVLEALAQWQDTQSSLIDAQRDEAIAAAGIRALTGDTP